MHENREASEMPEENIVDRTAGEGLSRTSRMHISEESAHKLSTWKAKASAQGLPFRPRSKYSGLRLQGQRARRKR
jgi:hypothetical protein